VALKSRLRALQHAYMAGCGDIDIISLSCLSPLFLTFRRTDWMKESAFQAQIRKEIENRYPGSIVVKLDPSNRQGLPDLLVLNKNHWAALEVKISGKAHHQPNQDRYIERMNKMSYASFIYPENKKEVYGEMEKLFKS